MRYWKRFVHRPSAGLPQCHAATIVERADGALVSGWYAGAHEKARDVAIYGAVLPPDAEEWEARGVFADTPQFSEGNPVLYEDASRRLWLFFVTLLGDRWDTGQVKCAHSLDGGVTWNPPFYVCDEWGRMTACKPLTLPDGAILLPLYLEAGGAFVLRTENLGQDWQTSMLVNTPGGVMQPALARRGDGSVLMYLRTCEADPGTVWQSVSGDGGRTWDAPTRAPLPNPNARLDLTRLASGRLAVAFNDSPDQRTPLTLALSEDDGASWPLRFDVESDAGEFSYPALIQARDGLLHLVYTYRRTHIAHVACDEAWIAAHARQR